MRDITINNNGSQEENQKTTPVTGSLSEPSDSSLSLSGEIFSRVRKNTKNEKKSKFGLLSAVEIILAGDEGFHLAGY